MELISQYLVERNTISSEDIVIIGRDQDYNTTVLLRSSEIATSTILRTDNLVLKTTVRIYTDDGHEIGSFHVIKCISDSVEDNNQFEKLIESFLMEKTEPITKTEIISIFQNLKRLFQTKKDNNSEILQIGLYGELSALSFLKKSGYDDLINHWHTDFYSKHDIELSEKKRLEIKTSITGKRIHHFKMDQLQIDGVDIYVYSVILYRMDAGKSLYELANEVLEYLPRYEQRANLVELMKKCGLSSETKGLTCDLDRVYDNIRLYDAEKIPHLSEKVMGVSNVSFDSDLEAVEDIDVNCIMGKK